MTREKQIEILMLDNCTKREAESHLKRGTIIFESNDFENNLTAYISEWYADFEAEEVKQATADFQKMIDTKKPMYNDWRVVEQENKTYYIQYAL